MKRREFLRLLGLAPLAAIPVGSTKEESVPEPPDAFFDVTWEAQRQDDWERSLQTEMHKYRARVVYKCQHPNMAVTRYYVAGENLPYGKRIEGSEVPRVNLFTTQGGYPWA